MTRTSDTKPHWSVWGVVGLTLVAPVAAPREAYVAQYTVWLALLLMVVFSPPRVSVKNLLLSPMGGVLLAFMAIAAIQLIPFPLSLLRVLSPYSAERYQVAAVDIHFAPITLDPTATWEVLHVCIFLATVAWWGMGYLKSERNLRLIEYAFIVSATAQAVIGTLMVVTNFEIGAYFQAKEAYIGSATGTFVNRSMFGLYLNLGIAVCIRILFFSALRPSGYLQLATRLAMVILVIGVTMSHSRAAALGFLCVLAVALVGLVLRRSGGANKSPRALLVLLASVVVVDLFVVSQWFGLEKLAVRAMSTSIEQEQRDDVAQLILAEYSPRTMPLGIGLGAFEAYYPQIESTYSNGRYVRAHSDVAELGLSLGLPALIILVLVARLVLNGNVSTTLLVSVMVPHVLLDFAVSNWLICFVLIALLPVESSNQKGKVGRIVWRFVRYRL